MKPLRLLCCCLLIACRAYAQVPYLPARNAVQLGADYLGIDPNNGLKFRYALDYRRYLSRDQVTLGVSVGIVHSQRLTVLVPDLVGIGANTRQRLTLDATATYNLLHSVHHALRLGIGPSAWYANDDLFVKVEPYPIPAGTVPEVQRRQHTGWSLGLNSVAEYTYALALNTQVSLHTGAALVGSSGLVPLFGFRAGYRF